MEQSPDEAIQVARSLVQEIGQEVVRDQQAYDSAVESYGDNHWMVTRHVPGTAASDAWARGVAPKQEEVSGTKSRLAIAQRLLQRAPLRPFTQDINKLQELTTFPTGASSGDASAMVRVYLASSDDEAVERFNELSAIQTGASLKDSAAMVRVFLATGGITGQALNDIASTETGASSRDRSAEAKGILLALGSNEAGERFQSFSGLSTGASSRDADALSKAMLAVRLLERDTDTAPTSAQRTSRILAMFHVN